MVLDQSVCTRQPSSVRPSAAHKNKKYQPKNKQTKQARYRSNGKGKNSAWAAKRNCGTAAVLGSAVLWQCWLSLWKTTGLSYGRKFAINGSVKCDSVVVYTERRGRKPSRDNCDVTTGQQELSLTEPSDNCDVTTVSKNFH